MTLIGLVTECKRVIEAGLTHVTLVVPGPPPRGKRVRLDRTSRRRCPMGQVGGWTEDGTVAFFNAIEVLAWLTARGYVQVVMKEEP